jgi:hypothetical protein
MPPADAHEFAVENVASQRKFGAGNALISVSLNLDTYQEHSNDFTQAPFQSDQSHWRNVWIKELRSRI